MEASKRERVIYGVIVPLLAAIIGVVGGIVGNHYFGASQPSDLVTAIIKDPHLTTPDKLKLIQAANYGVERFYNLLGTLLAIVGGVGGVVAGSFAYRR